MLRTISISTDVFAAIWAERKDDEENEDAILRRVLGCKSVNDKPQISLTTNGHDGVFDARNDVYFPQGFKAFRNYKHREYEAIAQDGKWLRPDTGKLYQTLNQLNASITAGNENIWNGNWKYRADNGMIRSINDLRK